MGKVVEIGIANIKGSEIRNVSTVEAIRDRGLVDDRNFNDLNNFIKK